MIEPGLYRHSKSGKLYTLHFIETDSETLEERVSYQAEYGDRKHWSRPARMWGEMVEVDGKQVERFTKVNPDRPPNVNWERVEAILGKEEDWKKMYEEKISEIKNQQGKK